MAYAKKEDLYRNQVARWIKIKIRAIEHKGGACNMCGGRFPYPAMQFHHRDPREKDVHWTKLRLRAWSRIVEELSKCDLLCANCHSIVHSSEWPARGDSNTQPNA